jgi:hypothetical protein
MCRVLRALRAGFYHWGWLLCFFWSRSYDSHEETGPCQKHFGSEEIIHKLCEADVLSVQGRTVAEIGALPLLSRRPLGCLIFFCYSVEP